MPSVLISVLPVLFVLILFRVGTRAVRPLLADMRAAAARPQRLLPQQSARAAQPGLQRALGQAIVVGAAATAIYIGLASVGTFRTPPILQIPLTYDFTYRYFPWQDFGLVAGVAIGLGLFASTWRTAFAAFVVLYVLLFVYDLAFNVAGAMTFETDSDFYGGGALGPYLWILYHALYAAAVAAGLSLVSTQFRAVAPWVILAAAGAASEYLFVNGMASPLEPFGIPYLLPAITIAAVAGWWMKRPGR